MTRTDTEEELRDRYLLSGIATGPAKPEEIDFLEQSLGVQLPVAYRAYLRVCGTHPPKSLVGSDCVIGHVQDNHEAALEILSEDDAASTVPDNFVVFLMHQGYTFLYFPLDGSDAPAVFSYLEGDGKPKQVADHLTHWVAGLR